MKSELNQQLSYARERYSLICYLATIKHIASFKREEFLNAQKTQHHKLSNLLKEHNVDTYIDNRSTYQLTFFEKLVLCRGLTFSFPHKTKPMEIRSSFEKLAVLMSRNMNGHLKENLACSLKTICEQYCAARHQNMPKSLHDAVQSLKKNNNIIISKPDKGNGVVILNKDDYTCLLRKASVDDATKFKQVSRRQPSRPGRPTLNFHPLLEKEKELSALLASTVPKSISSQLAPSGSRLAKLYGLPKTHKPRLAMRPILSAIDTYNFKLAKWLDVILKPLVSNQYMVHDTYSFLDDLKQVPVTSDSVLVSYDVTSLFTNVPLDETIEYLVDLAFKDNWLNQNHHLQLKKSDLQRLLEAATKNQLFSFESDLYEQFEGVAMGSPLGPLMANAFMCKLERDLEANGSMPPFYRRYVDDTLALFPNITEHNKFLDILNSLHPNITFTAELIRNNILPFIGINIEKHGSTLQTSVHHKSTDTGLLLHYHSHTDMKYKRGLIRTMVTRAFRISSSWQALHTECQRLSAVFTRLCYPAALINNTIRDVIAKHRDPQPIDPPQPEQPARLVIPYKSEKATRQLKNDIRSLNSRLRVNVQVVLTSVKLKQLLHKPDKKDAIVSASRVVYMYTCAACDMRYVGYTQRHLHQRVAEHQRASSQIAKHCLSTGHAFSKDQFRILAKCSSRLELMIRESHEILFKQPQLNAKDEYSCCILYRLRFNTCN